jgi:small GTP-binding protein
MPRVMVFNNKSPSDGKFLRIDEDSTLADLLVSASQTMGFTVIRLYSESGQVVTDPTVLREDDVLFASQGEDFTGRLQTYRQGGVKLMYKLAVMGPGLVGKSAITLSYVQRIFYEDYDPTIEDAYRKNVIIDDNPVMLDIVDTAGQDDYMSFRSSWMRDRDGFLLVFALNEPRTMNGLKTFYEQLCNVHEDNMPPIVVIGNKTDLVRAFVSSFNFVLIFFFFGPASTSYGS